MRDPIQEILEEIKLIKFGISCIMGIIMLLVIAICIF